MMNRRPFRRVSATFAWAFLFLHGFNLGAKAQSFQGTQGFQSGQGFQSFQGTQSPQSAPASSLPSATTLPDENPVNLKELLETLRAVKTQRATTEKNIEAKVFQDFRAAAASNATAIAFYQTALMMVRNRDTGDVKEFAKNEAMQAAARIHLNYLLLTLQKAKGTPMEQLEAAVLAHIAAVQEAGENDKAVWTRHRNQPKPPTPHGPGHRQQDSPPRDLLFWEQELITKNVQGSVFVKWYGIDKMVASVPDWEMTPGNLPGIYQNTLLPYYRKTRNARALACWDQVIKDEAQKAGNSHSAFNTDQFNRIRRPQLLWNQAKDAIAIGLPNRGLKTMVELVKAYPDHPDLPSWLSQLEARVQPPAPAPASPAPATPAPPSP